MSPRGHGKLAATADTDGIESSDAGLVASIGRILKILARPELSKWRPMMVLAILLTITAKLFAVSAPLFFGDAINALSEDQPILLPVLIGIGLWVGARFLSTGFPYLRDVFFAPISQDAMRVVAVEAFGHAQKLSYRFHLTRRTGALNRMIERGSGAIDFLIRFLAFNIGPTMIELTLASIVLGVKFGIGMSIIAIVTVICYVVFTLAITEWRVKQRRVLNEEDTELRGGMVDSLTNFETVKAFAAEDRETERHNESFLTYNKTFVSTARSLALLNAGQEFIMNLGLFGVAGLGVWAAIEGGLKPGDVAAVTLILMNLYRPLNILGWAWREIKQGSVDLEKLFGLMDMKPEVADAPDAKELDVQGGRVEFKNVAFSHDSRASGLEDVSFVAEAGKKLAIVGPSGSGKSTLLKMAFRFYDVEKGEILLDGQDLRSVTQKSLRESLGLVPQEVVLFNSTIKDNLIYGAPDATLEEIEAAADQAQLLDFVNGLPDKWDTRVGERGLKLSGGEKQRLGIARAILKNPPVLVLDEATSALDSTTEAEVQKALDFASKGRTTLVVAHRLSTIADADEIIVLKEGVVAEQGRHEDLLAQDGIYSEMWERQSKGGDEKVVEDKIA
ncbi:ABCB family ABC transporter ATP-binding protein/permease [Hirschia maritima]|uniref:ABCB family ABC transporter ATP-binding protein/permease n=1 Tax=Hirschia maritima TaxID=1121961 RepID=UPI00036031A4|nr:ABC transporter ATP-binding protein/permease [Hirschia maritima]